jgi:hypothetical protein
MAVVIMAAFAQEKNMAWIDEHRFVESDTDCSNIKTQEKLINDFNAALQRLDLLLVRMGLNTTPEDLVESYRLLVRLDALLEYGNEKETG